MDRIEPDSHHPAEPGQVTRFSIPNYSPLTDLRIVRVAPGLSITLSHFEEPIDRVSALQRRKETVLLVFGRKGKAALQVDGSGGWLTIAEGRCWLINPGRATIHRHLFGNCAASFFVVTLTPAELTAPLDRIVRRSLQSGVIAAELPDLREDLCFIEDLFRPSAGESQVLKIQARCLQLIGNVLEVIERKGAGGLEERLRSYLTERLSEPVTLADISQRFAMSHTSLNKRMRAACGKTVFEYLRELRIAKAVDLLRTSELSIAQVAHECGFASASHLSSTIRRALGTTAKALRH
ncbi:MAG: AraC family transcriptional regulator [Pseudomonadota bacterium]